MVMSFWESRYQVHGYALEWQGSGLARNSVCRHFLSVSKDFVLLAYCATLYIIRDPFFHPGPPILLLRFLESFVAARVSCCWVIVHKGHDASFYFEDRWYDDLSFVVCCDGSYDEFPFWEYCDVFVVRFSFVSAWRARECVGWCIGFSWYIKDFIVVFL